MLCFYEILRNYYRVFKLKFFSLFFSLCFFCVHYFSFAILTIIRTTNWQRAHINKASNINKIINCNYEIMAKSRYDAILNFPKNYLISSYLGVTLSSCNIQDNFASFKYLNARKTQTSLRWCWLTWLSAMFRSEKLIGVIRAFS